MIGLNQWIIAPVVVPLVAGGICMVMSARSPKVTAAVSLLGTLVFALVAAILLDQARDDAVQTYLLGNWQAPFGIALALDRLSALMLGLTALVALLALVYALAGDDRRGPHFHTLFQFQLMGLAGAFLTADLFNLFVFFEVLLCASYGLMLHGEGRGRTARLKATVHYLIFNLTGSALFLIAVALLYGITGTLNMADMALRLAALPQESAALAQSAALMLLVVFAVKAALLPLYFWLPDAYASATAPVAALFAIMTKVGVYGIIRTTTLLFADTGDELQSAVAGVFVPVLPALALATLVLAVLGVLSARRLRGLIAYLVVASAGTLLLAVGLATTDTIAAGLFYLVHSTLTASVWFLLADRIGGARSCGDELQHSVPMPQHAWAPMGIAFFIASVAVAGMPPLAGFLGKALLLDAAGTTGFGTAVFVGVLLSSFGVLIALSRAGSAIFWRRGADAEAAHPPDSSGRSKSAAIALGLGLMVATSILAKPIGDYTNAAAIQLADRRAYIDAVLDAQPVPPLYDIRREMRERGEGK